MRLSAILLLAVTIAAAAAGQTPHDNWDLTIRARTNSLTDSLARMGIRPDATSDFENAYDVPRPPRSPSGSYLEVYFPHSGGGYPPVLGTRYATDYQGPADPVWNLSVECSTPSTLTLSWDSSVVDGIEPRLQLFLVDLSSGQKVNMRVSGRYTFSYTAKRDFQIVGAVKVNLTCLLEGFWNGSSQPADTVTGYLAAAAAPHAPVDSARAVLSTAGTGMLVFPSAPTGSYYLVVHHRNHLGVWTAAPQALTKGTTGLTPYDFSAGAGTAFGADALKAEGGVFLAWAGDIDQNGVIDYRDRNAAWNDRGLSGYRASDCDGNGAVDAPDYALALANRLRILQRP